MPILHKCFQKLEETHPNLSHEAHKTLVSISYKDSTKKTQTSFMNIKYKNPKANNSITSLAVYIHIGIKEEKGTSLI